MSESMMANFNDEIKQILSKYPSFSDDDAFVYWYVNYLTGSEKDSEDAITGISNDKGIDAIWIDDDSKTVEKNIKILSAKNTQLEEKFNDLLQYLRTNKIEVPENGINAAKLLT